MIAVDSSVIISALLSWHEFHQRATVTLEKIPARKKLLLPLPVLMESYSVMTRLPAPFRLAPNVAHQLLYASFGNASVVALRAEKGWPLLTDCQAFGITGGRIYDALIATIAIEAGAKELLTFNPRHFEPFSDNLRITAP